MLLAKSASSPMFMGSFKFRSRLLTHYYCALAACRRSINTAKLAATMGWSPPNVQGLKHIYLVRTVGKDLAGSTS